MIGSVGETEFRIGDGGPELVKTAKVGIINDGPQKPSSIHRHVGQRPTVAAGNTDGDLAMLQWTAASPYRTLELVVHHTDGDREYAYDRDPILGSGTGQILAAAAEHKCLIRDGYFPDHANAALRLLPEWTQWCIGQSGLNGDLAARSRVAALTEAAALVDEESNARAALRNEPPFRRQE